MKKTKQLTFLPEPQPEAVEAEATEPPAPAGGGIPIDPDQVIRSLDDAIEKLGRELGRLNDK